MNLTEISALLEKLSNAHGISSREFAIAKIIRDEVAPYVDEITTDKMGNLVTVKKGDDFIGMDVQANFIKHRFGAPFTKAVYRLYYGEGIRRSDEAVEVAKDLGIIVGKGWYTFPISATETERLQGIENVIN